MSAAFTIVRAGDELSRRGSFLDWLRLHLIDPNLTYEIENVDDSYVVVRQYALNAEGHKYVEPETGDAAIREPFELTIVEPMPR